MDTEIKQVKKPRNCSATSSKNKPGRGSATDKGLDEERRSAGDAIIADLRRKNEELIRRLVEKETEKITRESKKKKTGHGLGLVVAGPTQGTVVVAVVPGEKISPLNKHLLTKNFQGYIESKFFGEMKFLMNERINKHVCQQAIEEGWVSSCQGFSGDDELCLYLENTLLPQVLNKIRHNTQSYARRKWLGKC